VPRTPPVTDPALLEAHEVTDPERVAWWRARLDRVRVELGHRRHSGGTSTVA
jgi:o-succinylbenzoate synthase